MISDSLLIKSYLHPALWALCYWICFQITTLLSSTSSGICRCCKISNIKMTPTEYQKIAGNTLKKGERNPNGYQRPGTWSPPGNLSSCARITQANIMTGNEGNSNAIGSYPDKECFVFGQNVCLWNGKPPPKHCTFHLLYFFFSWWGFCTSCWKIYEVITIISFLESQYGETSSDKLPAKGVIKNNPEINARKRNEKWMSRWWHNAREAVLWTATCRHVDLDN